MKAAGSDAADPGGLSGTAGTARPAPPGPNGDSNPLPAMFEAALAGLGPWPAAPHLAVAVSGGADSMALCCLTDGWTRQRGGRVTALIVDHGLRPDSAAEARQAAAWLQARGIAHAVLTWSGPKPNTALQAAARKARYDLLSTWCRRHGVTTLLTGHHALDQAETVRMRAGRGSGPAGLSGMAAIREVAHLRLVRPLLSVAPSRLRAWLRAIGQPWIEDPSNRDPRYRRAQLRAQPCFPGETERLLVQAAAQGRRRAEAGKQTARDIAQAVRATPAGYALVDLKRMPETEERAAALFARLLHVVGGDPYAPSAATVRRHLSGFLDMPGQGAVTLAGCWIGGHPERHADAGDRLLICREAGRCAAVEVLSASGDPGFRHLRWDNRFDITLDGVGPTVTGLTVGPLGETGWATLVAAEPALRASAIPWRARLSLPALFRNGVPMAVPSLRFTKAMPAEWRLRMDFRPGSPLAAAPFRPVDPPADAPTAQHMSASLAGTADTIV